MQKGVVRKRLRFFTLYNIDRLTRNVTCSLQIEVLYLSLLSFLHHVILVPQNFKCLVFFFALQEGCGYS